MKTMTKPNINIPAHLIEQIKNMACARKCNSCSPSNEIIITFGLNRSAKRVHEEGALLKWVLSCLDGISDRVFDGGSYKWNVISQVPFDNIALGSDTRHPPCMINRIMVAIHIGGEQEYSDVDKTLIPFEDTPPFKLTPQEIMTVSYTHLTLPTILLV